MLLTAIKPIVANIESLKAVWYTPIWAEFVAIPEITSGESSIPNINLSVHDIIKCTAWANIKGIEIFKDLRQNPDDHLFYYIRGMLFKAQKLTK